MDFANNFEIQLSLNYIENTKYIIKLTKKFFENF